MAGCWKVLFEVEVVDVPVVGSDEDVAVVVSVDGAEPDVMAMDEAAAEDTGETAIDVAPPTPMGEAATADGLALGGWPPPVRRSSKAEFLESFPPTPLFPVITSLLLEPEVVTSLIWSLVELSGGEFIEIIDDGLFVMEEEVEFSNIEANDRANFI